MMNTPYKVVFLDELSGSCSDPPFIHEGCNVHVVGVLCAFPTCRTFGVLALDGHRLDVDFDLVDLTVSLAECHLFHVLGELRDIREIETVSSDELRISGTHSGLYLKARFVRAAVGLDVKLYKLSILERRNFLRSGIFKYLNRDDKP